MTLLRAEPLTAEAFAAFGRVVERPERPPDAAGAAWRWWAETALLASDGRAYGVGYLELEPGERAFDWAERHMLSVEGVIPLEGECLLYAGPPEHLDEPDRVCELDRFRVFRVRPGQAALLERGVWHGAPLALARPARALVLLLEGTGREDTHVARFPERPVEVES